MRIQRHLCQKCGKSYSEEYAFLVRRSWYGRDVRRYAVDQWVHGRTSLRRTAEFVRSLMGHQDRWWYWHPWEEPKPGRDRCKLSHTTLQRWLDMAGVQAQESIPGQLEGLETSGQMGTDGLWVRLRGKGKRVILSLVDSATGLICGVIVTKGEEAAESWQLLFERARAMGLAWEQLNGVTSDGAHGLLSFMRSSLSGVHHQRCIWHFWRGLAKDLKRAAAQASRGLDKETAQNARQELTSILHGIIDAPSFEQAEKALAQLNMHPQGKALAKKVNEQLDRLLYHLLASHQGLIRVGPEWLWRDFRLRLSHGRNHGSTERNERAALVWSIYHNFTPAQRRSERKRIYKHPGQSPLQVAGGAPDAICYLDALGV